MLAIELRWLLFGLLLAMGAVALLAIWLDRRWRKRGGGSPADLEAVLEHAPFGWLVLDLSLTCRYANAYARRLLGLTSSTGPLPSEEWAFLLDDDRAIMRRDTPRVGRYRTVSLPSGRVAWWWIAPWGDLDVVFLLDTTAQKQAEKAANYLLDNLSHELRTPIGAILTHLEVLLLPNIPSETRQQSVHLLKAETRRLARLVNLMLELGRLETSTEIERRPVDLLPLVERVITHITPQAEERGIAISLQAETPLPLVAGDADRLMQVFLNLLDNVVKHCRPGDRAVISLRRMGEGIECTVRDNGPGIPAHHLPHIATRFYRAAPQEVEGSGLGLALVKEILHRHGSHLEIESHTEGEERGTCVRFVLPAIEGDERRP